MIKKFYTTTFPKFMTFNEILTLKLTIDTSKSKTFTITGLTKGTAPKNIIIDWGDGNVSTYDDLPIDNPANTFSHTYVGNTIRTIEMKGRLVESKNCVTYKNNINLISVEGNIFIYFCDDIKTPNDADVYLVNEFFRNCTNLQSISGTIFDKCIKIKNLFYCFRGCSNLTSVPVGLLDNNIELWSIRGLIMDCVKIKNVPDNLFLNNIVVRDCYSVFNGCSGLTSINPNIFDTISTITVAGWTFYNCTNITSAVPDLWNKIKFPNISIFTQCFLNCNKSANNAQIPAAWKK